MHYEHRANTLLLSAIPCICDLSAVDGQRLELRRITAEMLEADVSYRRIVGQTQFRKTRTTGCQRSNAIVAVIAAIVQDDGFQETTMEGELFQQRIQR